MLCSDENNYYLYDKFFKKYFLLGPIDSYIYDDVFFYDMEEERMFMIYNEQILDITDYYMKNLKDKETISISHRVTGILSPDIFRLKNRDEIEKIIREAKDENLRIIEEQKREREKQDIEQLKIESEQAEKERLENLRQALKDLKEVIERVKKYSKPGEAPRRIPIGIPYITAGDHYEIPVELKGILKYIDLSAETFANVNVEGVDFSDCNPHILDPQLVYRKSLRNCKFDRVYINPFTNYIGVDIRGCSFSDDGNPLTMDVFNVSFARAIYDETTTYNGVPMTELLGTQNKEQGEGFNF
jgi:vacuolar-type H+-ATPase subunit H